MKIELPTPISWAVTIFIGCAAMCLLHYFGLLGDVVCGFGVLYLLIAILLSL